jgi:hypothetical protein
MIKNNLNDNNYLADDNNNTEWNNSTMGHSLKKYGNRQQLDSIITLSLPLNIKLIALLY